MLFWPPKDFHKLTKHWNFGPALLSGCLFSPDIELSETVWLWLLFSPPWGRVGDGFAWPHAAARSLTQGRHEIRGVTGSSCACPGQFWAMPTVSASLSLSKVSWIGQ